MRAVASGYKDLVDPECQLQRVLRGGIDYPLSCSAVSGNREANLCLSNSWWPEDFADLLVESTTEEHRIHVPTDPRGHLPCPRLIELKHHCTWTNSGEPFPGKNGAFPTTEMCLTSNWFFLF